MTLDLQTFTRLDLHGRIAASRLEADLADAIRAPLEQAVHHAHARLVAVTAAGEWHVPDQDEVVNLSQLIALLTAAVEPVRRRILDSILIPTMEAAGINFTVRNDLAEGVLAQLGQRISMLAEGEREQIMNRLDAAWTAGESIPQAAEGLLGLNIDGITMRRATMIARTELAATTNGASLAAARITGAAPYKVWLTAPGAPHPRHELIEGLDGQTVPIDGLFDVDGAMLDHPGDPNGPPEAVIQCRCTCAYSDSMTASHRPADRRGRLMPVPRPLTAAATPFTDLPLSAQDAPWDAAAAEAAMTTPDQLKQGHFWMDTSDGADPASKASYKLPFVADGKAVWAGCTAAAGACMGARGGVSIPDADMPGVKAHIARYYAKAADSFGDDSITPPWMAQTAARLRARQAGITASLSLVAAAGDAGGMPTCGSWRMETATLLDTMTPDGRTLASAGMTMREMPLPLMAMFDDSHDPNGMSPLPPTVCVGRIEMASVEGDRLVESGVFYDTPDGQRAMMEAADGVLRPSIDGFPMAWTLSFAPWDEAANGPEMEMDGEGEVTAVRFRADEQQILFSEWELVSTTLVRVPAVPTASIDVLMDGEMGAPSAVAASALSAFSVREKPRPAAAVEESLPAALAAAENGSQPVLLALDALAANMRATSGLSAIEALAASLRRNAGERAPGDVDLVELVRAVGEASRDPAMPEMARAVAAAAGRPLPEPAPITVHSSPVTLNPSDVHVDVQPPHVEVTAGGKPRALRAERDSDGNVTRYVEEEVVNG